MLSVGKKFPLFDLTGVDATNDIVDVSTADIANDWAVIYFYPKDFTFICPTEINCNGFINTPRYSYRNQRRQ